MISLSTTSDGYYWPWPTPFLSSSISLLSLASPRIPLFYLSSLSLIMLLQGINTWSCSAVTYFTAIKFLSLGFHHSCSTPTVCFHFFVNFVHPHSQPYVYGLKLNFLLAIIFQACGGKQPGISLKHLNRVNHVSFFFHRLNINCAFLLRVGYRCSYYLFLVVQEFHDLVKAMFSKFKW